MADDVVRAKRFELVDDDGKVRAVLGSELDGAPVLAFWGGDGGMRARLTLRDTDLPTLEFLDEDGEARMSLQRVSDGTWGLYLTDEGEKPRVQLTLTDNPHTPDFHGQVALTLHALDGSPRSLVAVRNDGTPTLEMRDEWDQNRVQMAMFNDGSQRLSIGNQQGEWATVRCDQGGMVTVLLTDRSGRQANLTLVPGRPPQLAVMDEHGNRRVLT